MIVIDLDLNEFKRRMKKNVQGGVFYTRDMNKITMYTDIGNKLLRTSTEMLDEGNEALFWEQMMITEPVRVLNVGWINEDEWREAINAISSQLDGIRSELEEIKKAGSENVTS